MTGRRQRGDSPIEDEPSAIRRRTDGQTGGNDGQPEGNEGQTDSQPIASAGREENPEPSETPRPQIRPRFEIPEPPRVTEKGRRKYKKTELGKIFGANINADTGESGWSPINEQHSQTWRGFKKEEQKKEHQQGNLYGFDSNQLVAIGAVPIFKREVKEIVGLDNPIHPIFDRGNWRTRETNQANRAHWRIGMGKKGYWEAKNPVVWKILEPILQLASRFIMNSRTSHWWDSLTHGARIPLDPPAPEKYGTLRTFHKQPAAECYSRRELVQSLINKTAGRIAFGIENGNMIPQTGLCRPSGEPDDDNSSFLAFVHWYDTNGTGPIDLNISYHLLTPFFRKDLTQAEGFALKVFAAGILIHELGHAVGDLNRRDNRGSEGLYATYELFFEEEALAEFGYSVTMANMGLLTDAAYLQPTPFAYFAHEWPRRDGNDMDGTYLKYARPLDNYDMPKVYYPVPCKFFEDLCQKDFWDGYVQLYMDTGKALHIGKFAGGGQKTKCDIEPGMSRWNARPPPENDPAVVVIPPTRESVLADSLHRGRLQAQVKARAALLTARTSLTNWRSRFNRKKKKHDRHAAERERIRQNVQEPVDPPGSPVSDLTTSEPDESDLELQEGNESDFDYEQVLPFQPPMRYTYIHRSMCQFRFILGLETMTKEIPVNLLLEYLNRVLSKFKRRTIGPEEFFEYLKYLGTEWDICFDLYEGQHGTADVSYRALGWPSVEECLPQQRPPLPDLHRDAEQLETDVDDFREICEEEDIWTRYNFSATARRAPHIDIDMEDIRQFFNSHYEAEDQVDADVFLHIVSRCPDLWAFGPPGIMRYVGIDPWVGAKEGRMRRHARRDTEMTDPDAVVGM